MTDAELIVAKLEEIRGLVLSLKSPLSDGSSSVSERELVTVLSTDGPYYTPKRNDYFGVVGHPKKAYGQWQIDILCRRSVDSTLNISPASITKGVSVGVTRLVGPIFYVSLGFEQGILGTEITYQISDLLSDGARVYQRLTLLAG